MRQGKQLPLKVYTKELRDHLILEHGCLQIAGEQYKISVPCVGTRIERKHFVSGLLNEHTKEGEYENSY